MINHLYVKSLNDLQTNQKCRLTPTLFHPLSLTHTLSFTRTHHLRDEVSVLNIKNQIVPFGRLSCHLTGRLLVEETELKHSARPGTIITLCSVYVQLLIDFAFQFVETHKKFDSGCLRSLLFNCRSGDLSLTCNYPKQTVRQSCKVIQ